MRRAIVVAMLLLGACGDDSQSHVRQITDPLDGSSPLDPVGVGKQCETSANCEDGDRCTADRCVAKHCVQITVPSEECCPATTLFSDSFDDGQAHLATSALNNAAGWHVDDHRAVSGSSLYFGDPTSHTYDKGVQVAGSAELPVVTLPRDKASVLSLRIYALIEDAPDYDLFWIEADVAATADKGPETLRLFSKSQLPVGAYEDFALVDVPLTGLEGRDVVLRMRFDSLDGTSNGHEGIYVDDVKVEALCPLGLECLEDKDCADDDICTAEACTEAGCGFTDICQEINPCEQDDAPADCCIADADCDDHNPATIDVCNGATCEHTLNPDACLSPADCDDGEACTTESCTDAICGHTGTIGPGCCEPADTSIATFADEALQGIYVTDNFETGIFWRPDQTRATSDKYALYCGDPVTQTYAHDSRVKSSATTRTLTIPKGGQTTIEVDIYKDTRTAKNYDVFQVFVLRDGALLPAWSSKSLSDGTTGKQWQHLVVPLSTYAGDKIQVRFVFDSVDAPSGPFEGVYLDTMRLVTRCN